MNYFGLIINVIKSDRSTNDRIDLIKLVLDKYDAARKKDLDNQIDLACNRD